MIYPVKLLVDPAGITKIFSATTWMKQPASVGWTYSVMLITVEICVKGCIRTLWVIIRSGLFICSQPKWNVFLVLLSWKVSTFFLFPILENRHNNTLTNIKMKTIKTIPTAQCYRLWGGIFTLRLYLTLVGPFAHNCFDKLESLPEKLCE